MEVVNPRAALLSNLEVLQLLRELEADHLASQKSALKIKKEEEQTGIQNPKNPPQNDQISENLRTIEVEASFFSFSSLFYDVCSTRFLSRLSSTSQPAISRLYRYPRLASKTLSRRLRPSG